MTYKMPPTDAETGRTARFSHIFARLLELQNYVWDPEIEPFHSVSFHDMNDLRAANPGLVL
jgi:hypothetical protein